uniref:Uncharacterized protein n=1 Tax=Ananas comosus var. bracteatus TaxID=296719 RepID=A0A6V7P9M9_ANACO|nr:unnamed protein product [Ananas comosus var. bracteatus]
MMTFIDLQVYFWSLPSCAGIRSARNKVESDLSSSRKRFKELIEHRDNLKKGRKESDGREAALEELNAVELQHKKLNEELACYADNDPAALEALSKRSVVYILYCLYVFHL